MVAGSVAAQGGSRLTRGDANTAESPCRGLEIAATGRNLFRCNRVRGVAGCERADSSPGGARCPPGHEPRITWAGRDSESGSTPTTRPATVPLLHAARTGLRLRSIALARPFNQSTTALMDRRSDAAPAADDYLGVIQLYSLHFFFDLFHQPDFQSRGVDFVFHRNDLTLP